MNNFYNCCDSVVNDHIVNDGRNYLLMNQVTVGAIVPKDIALFNFGWLLIQYHDITDSRKVRRRPILCDIVKGGDGMYYVTGASAYSLTTNTSLSIKINTTGEKWVVESITQTGNTEEFPTTYLSLVGVGVL